MLEWFTDDCTFPALLGFLMAVIFMGLALSAGSKPLLKAGLAIGILTVMLVTTEVLYVSDRESASGAVYDMASALRENDFEYIYARLADDELVGRAKAELRGATCHACRITAMNDVQVSDDGTSASVDFVAFAKASNDLFRQPTPVQQRVVLHMKKSADKWIIHDFENSSPRAGLTP